MGPERGRSWSSRSRDLSACVKGLNQSAMRSIKIDGAVDVRNDEVQTINLERHDWTTLGGMIMMMTTMCWRGILAIALVTKGVSRRYWKQGIKHKFLIGH